MLSDDYRKSLRRWMTNLGVVAFLVFALGIWYTVYQQSIEAFFVAAWLAVVLTGGTFILVTLYFVVLGFLSTKPGTGANP